MKTFLKKIFVFIFIFFLIDKIFYIFIFMAPSKEVDRRLEKLINGKINKDIIILGSSRGARNVIAKQIQDSLGVSTYNLSYPGSNIEFHKFLLETLIKFNKKPKYVLLVVDDIAELSPSNAIVFRFDRLYPLVKYDYINNELIKRGESGLLSYVMALARMKRNNLYIWKKHFSRLDTILECGSMPLSFQKKTETWDYQKSIAYNIRDEIPQKLEAYSEFQKLCIENKINLIVIFPPNYRKFSVSFEKRMKELSDRHVSFYVYDTLNNVYKDKAFFYDRGHLQKKGAVIFTNEIIKMLKAQMDNN